MATAFVAPAGAVSLRETALLPAHVWAQSRPAVRPRRRTAPPPPRALLSRSIPWPAAGWPTMESCATGAPPALAAAAAAADAAAAVPSANGGAPRAAAAPSARSSRGRRRPALAALVWLAALARRVKRVRTAPGLRLARAGASLAVAAVGLAVSRGALSSLAMAGAGMGGGAATATAAAAAPVAIAGPLHAATRILAGLVPERMRIFARPFTEAFGVVFLSEFGDKSMFATALMAMKHSPVLVLLGALVALTVMTLIACFLGQLMHLLPTTVTHYSTIALFVFFGLQMIWQSRSLPDKPGGSGGERAGAEELVASSTSTSSGSFGVFAKISSLIFVAEWCDRSMLATMALAATSNTAAVIGGATVANVLCTGLAVGSAALVSSRISERLVALVAGILFEFFAVFTYFEGPEGE